MAKRLKSLASLLCPYSRSVHAKISCRKAAEGCGSVRLWWPRTCPMHGIPCIRGRLPKSAIRALSSPGGSHEAGGSVSSTSHQGHSPVSPKAGSDKPLTEILSQRDKDLTADLADQQPAETTYKRKAETMMVRDFVFHSLYGSGVGYFQEMDVVGSVAASSIDSVKYRQSKAPESGDAGLNFGNMLGEIEYRHVVAQLYKEGGSAWLTPSELFHPWYARAVARYVVDHLKKSQPTKKLRVLEVGGGNGTFALGFNDYIRTHHQDIYRDLEYTLVEVSQKLAEVQRNRVCSRHPCVSVVHANGTARETLRALNWYPGDDEALYIMAFEVLDNMPHDKIVVGDDGVVREVAVSRRNGSNVVTGDGKLIEILQPLSDPCIHECLQASKLLEGMSEGAGGADGVGGAGGGWGGAGEAEKDFRTAVRGLFRRLVGQETIREMFVPTEAFRFLSALSETFPAASLILADFDELPDAIPGVNGPVVQSKHNGTSRFHSSYLVPVGSADIFHPTDFRQLQHMYHHLTGERGYVISHKEFVLRWGEVESTRTLTGYNPLVEDYSNMAMFVAHRRAAPK